MTDAGTPIPVEIEFANMQSDKELRTNNKILVGYISMLYESPEDFSLTIKYRRTNELNWEETAAWTVSKDNKRFFEQVHLGLSIIDAYPRIVGNFSNLEITSCKLLVDYLPSGKFG